MALLWSETSSAVIFASIHIDNSLFSLVQYKMSAYYENQSALKTARRIDLSDLPSEIIKHIASQLEHVDIFSLRLVCRTINEKSFYYFSHECFATISTVLSLSSLQMVKRISEDDRLSFNVKKLLIKGRPSDIGQGLQWNRHLDGYFVAPLPCIDILRTILIENLVNCRSFHICRQHQEDMFYTTDKITPGDVSAVLLTMVAETGLTIKSFILDFKRHGTGRIDWKRLQTVQYQVPTFRAGWDHLEELDLSFTLTSELCDLAMGLITQASNLRNLTLSIDNYESESFLDHLSRAEKLPELQKLHLSSMWVMSDSVSRLLQLIGGLRVLSFQYVMLADGSWKSAFQEIRKNLPLLEDISVKRISDSNSDATSMDFGGIAEDPIVPETNGRRFELVRKKVRRVEKTIGVSYEGPRMDQALQILGNSLDSSGQN